MVVHPRRGGSRQRQASSRVCNTTSQCYIYCLAESADRYSLPTTEAFTTRNPSCRWRSAIMLPSRATLAWRASVLPRLGRYVSHGHQASPTLLADPLLHNILGASFDAERYSADVPPVKSPVTFQQGVSSCYIITPFLAPATMTPAILSPV